MELIPREQQGITLKVFMNASILSIPTIDTVNMKCTIDFYLRMRWYDFRIDFRDLNHISSLNSLNMWDRAAIWSPHLSFVNALGPYQTEIDELTSGELVRETGPLPEDYSTSIEGKNAPLRLLYLFTDQSLSLAMLFSGKNNSIVFTREYYQDYACQFDLHLYPFDTQVCEDVLRPFLPSACQRS
jgi:hypothetical protein